MVGTINLSNALILGNAVTIFSLFYYCLIATVCFMCHYVVWLPLSYKEVKLLLSMPWRHIGGRRYSSIHSYFWLMEEVSGELHTPRHFTCRQEPWNPFSRRLGGSQSQSGLFGRRENLLTLQKFEPLTVQPIANRCPTSFPLSYT